jgi:hypothetical protein
MRTGQKQKFLFQPEIKCRTHIWPYGFIARLLSPKPSAIKPTPIKMMEIPKHARDAKHFRLHTADNQQRGQHQSHASPNASWRVHNTASIPHHALQIFRRSHIAMPTMQMARSTSTTTPGVPRSRNTCIPSKCRKRIATL